MALTARKEIIGNLQYWLGTINQANGYQTAGFATVARHRDTAVEPFAPEEVPAVNIIDSLADITHNVSDDIHDLSVSIEIHTTSRITADQAEEMLGDVVRCIDLNGMDSAWGGHADGTTIESHNIDVAQTGDTIYSGNLVITIHYTTEKGKI